MDYGVDYGVDYIDYIIDYTLDYGGPEDLERQSESPESTQSEFHVDFWTQKETQSSVMVALFFDREGRLPIADELEGLLVRILSLRVPLIEVRVPFSTEHKRKWSI